MNLEKVIKLSKDPLRVRYNPASLSEIINSDDPLRSTLYVRSPDERQNSPRTSMLQPKSGGNNRKASDLSNQSKLF